MKLSVNVDHVATVRQARGVDYPDPIEAAAIAEAAGADGITVHLRGDRRHIQDDDVRRLRESVRGRLNLEVAATDEMLRIAETVRPDLVTLVPERAEEITTEGGLDLVGQHDRVAEWVQRLASASVPVSVFVDPVIEQIEALAAVRDRLSLEGEAGDNVVGYEINTDAYARACDRSASSDPDETAAASDRELSAIRSAATLGARFGLAVYAGHALTTTNVGKIAGIEEIEELNIGHWLVSRSILVGMDAAVREMLTVMSAGAAGASLP